MTMDFLQDLSEARLTGRSKSGLKKFSARDIADLLFLHILGLQIMKHEFYGLPMAEKYVHGAGSLTNFDNYSTARNELYLLIHLIAGKRSEAQRKLLKDPEESQVLFDSIRLNMPMMRKYLRMVQSGVEDESFERRFLLQLERDLRITNAYYRAIRRLASTWTKQEPSTRKLVMTRLLQIFRSKARKSEMMPMLEKLSKEEHLEKKGLDPLEGEGLGQNQKTKQSSGFLKGLGLAAAGLGAAYAGYHLARKKNET